MNLVKDADYQRDYNDYTFKGKKADEHIILMLRRHWIIIFVKIIFMLVILSGILIIHFFVGPYLVNNLNLINNPDFLVIISTFMLMFYWISLFVVWIDYYFDVWIVTDQRIVNIEQKGLFRREISELKHSKIQDVTTEVTGMIPTFFRYGYVHIQTAGKRERFVFKQVPHPVKVRGIIMKLHKDALKKKVREESYILRGKE